MYEAEVFGIDDTMTDSACGMPVSAQMERLGRELERRQAGAFEIVQTDLYGLEGPGRDAAIDAVVAGEPSPFVILDGRIVCTGSVDIEAVAGALAAR